MNTMSESKLGGIAISIGAAMVFITFFIGVIAGGTPEKGVNVFAFFANDIASKGTQSLLFAVMSGIGLALLSFGYITLNKVIQEQEKNPLLSFGTFMLVLGNIAYIFVWCMDIAIVFSTNSIPLVQMFRIEMGLFFVFGVIYNIGFLFYALSIAKKEYINSTIAKIVAGVSAVMGVLYIYTLLTLDQGNVDTIMPLFMGLGLANLLYLVFNVMLGRKMMQS